MILREHKDLEPVRGKGRNSIEKQEREDAENGCLPDSLTVLGGLGSESDLSLFNSHTYDISQSDFSDSVLSPNLTISLISMIS